MASKLTDKLVLSDVLDGSSQYVWKDDIEIFNNKQFTLDVSGVKFLCSDRQIIGSQINKIKIDWGDGKQQFAAKRIHSVTSSIGVWQNDQWTRIKHHFNTDKRNVYLTKDVRSLPKIVITFYNTFNDKVQMYIPYKLVYKSMYDMGTKFTMKSGNITNTNHSSFVLKNQNDNSLFVVSVKDFWKKILNQDDQVVYINDTVVSKNYADQFVNQDSIIWDWKGIPLIALHVQRKVENGIRFFKCKFDQKNVNLDSWTPKCFQILDGHQRQLTNFIIDRSYRQFSVYDGTQSNIEDLSNGLYKIYVQMVGINQVSGTSQIKYVKSSDDFFSDKIQVLQYIDFQTQKLITQFQSLDETERYITFRYQLPTGAYPSHIQYANIFLTSFCYDDSNNGISETFTDNEQIKFQYELNLESPIVIGENVYYQTRIPFREIPNGKYNVTIQVKQLPKTNDDTAQTKIYQFVQQEGKVQYNPKQITLNYTNIGSITEPIIKNERGSLDIEWTINQPSQMSNVLYRVSKLDDTAEETVVDYYVVQKNQGYTNYNFTENTNNYNFYQTIVPQTIQDGLYKVQVGHVIPMQRFVGQRQTTASCQYNYKYNCPELTVVDFCPYLKKSGKNLIPYLRIVGTSNENNISGIQINFNSISQSGDIVYEGVKLTGNKLLNDVILGQIFDYNKYNQSRLSLKAYNTKDELYKRKQAKVNYTLGLLKNFDKDYLTNDYSNQQVTYGQNYIKKSTGQKFSGKNLIDNTFYNIKKDYRWVQDNGTICYSNGSEPQFISVDGNGIKTLFVGQIYNTDNEKSDQIYRYQPCLSTSGRNFVQVDKLKTVRQYLSNKGLYVEREYNKKYNTFMVTVSSKEPLNPIGEYGQVVVNDAVVRLYKQSQYPENPLYTINLRKNFYTNFSQIQGGKYIMQIDFHSTQTENVSNSLFVCSSDDKYDYKIENLNILVPYDQAMQFSHEIVQISSSEIDRFFRVKYTVFQKGIKNLRLFYRISTKTIWEGQNYDELNVTDITTQVEQDKFYKYEKQTLQDGTIVYQQYDGYIKCGYIGNNTELPKIIYLKEEKQIIQEQQKVIQTFYAIECIKYGQQQTKQLGATRIGQYELPYRLIAGVTFVQYCFNYDSDIIDWGDNQNKILPIGGVKVDIV